MPEFGGRRDALAVACTRVLSCNAERGVDRDADVDCFGFRHVDRLDVIVAVLGGARREARSPSAWFHLVLIGNPRS